MARIQIRKKTRFEVFKRDKFTCQYCGRTAPDVILEIDDFDAAKEYMTIARNYSEFRELLTGE